VTASGHTRAAGVGLACLVFVATTAAAQTPSQSDAEYVKQRQRISMMEGMLERAVANGAENLMREIRQVMPDTPMLTGVPEVRGFRLEGYGVFFDVEVPALRTPLSWTLRYMADDNNRAAATLLTQVRQLMAQQPADRDRLELFARQLEERVAVTQQNRPPSPVIADPSDAYTRAVKEALVDAMIEHSTPLQLGPGEWLTVAARDNVPRDPLVPGDTDLQTLTFRVKGDDLAAFRAGRLTLEDVRKRVEIRQN
jgi:hypothetical protein